ncbi:response regulator [Pseudoxanthomonas composti]|uniref:Response regulator n=1 Tax=Pseudoxanthomonas composti TaxID=2137479 RepID=A0A4Q1JXR9_9GAMM|nr:response regulator [Pseudoxanthomonas composti]RXR06600.1 response regulator [Pseudoxanthomonas composti]
MNSVLSGLKVLVVEDEPLVAILVEEVMDQAGARATIARDVPQALKALEAERFDAAVVDLNLRGQQSWPVADALVAQGIPYVLATGNADMGDARLQAAPVVAKPYSATQLVKVLGQAIAERAQA